MDRQRIDTVAKTLASGRSRREVMRALAGIIAGGLTTRLAPRGDKALASGPPPSASSLVSSHQADQPALTVELADRRTHIDFRRQSQDNSDYQLIDQYLTRRHFRPFRPQTFAVMQNGIVTRTLLLADYANRDTGEAALLAYSVDAGGATFVYGVISQNEAPTFVLVVGDGGAVEAVAVSGTESPDAFVASEESFALCATCLDSCDATLGVVGIASDVAELTAGKHVCLKAIAIVCPATAVGLATLIACVAATGALCVVVIEVVEDAVGEVVCDVICTETGNCCEPTPCDEGQTFDAGACQCVCSEMPDLPNPALCNGRCVSSDCGANDQIFNPTTCGCECILSDRDVCNGECVPRDFFETSPFHCGGCGNECPINQSCVGGECRSEDTSAGRLVIHKVDANNRPLLDACFWVYTDAGDGTRDELIDPVNYNGCNLRAFFGSTGTITIEPLDPGAYVLAEIIAPPGHALGMDQPFAISPGQTTEITIQNVRGGATLIVHTVNQNNEPLAECYDLYADAGGGTLGALISRGCDFIDGTDGTTTIHGLPAGDYVLTDLLAPPVVIHLLSISSDETREITIRCNDGCTTHPDGSRTCTGLRFCVPETGCAAGLTDCGAGCVDVSTHPDHCGGCGNACSGEGMATVTCEDGVCNGACDAGNADCDGDKLSNGCETQLGSATHCLTCGDGCDDGDPCTTDTCEEVGCTHSPIPGCCHTAEDCDDADPCTVDECNLDGHGCMHTPVDCSALSDACIDGTCVGSGQCVAANKPDGTSCGQNGEICVGGSCSPRPDAPSDCQTNADCPSANPACVNGRCRSATCPAGADFCGIDNFSQCAPGCGCSDDINGVPFCTDSVGCVACSSDADCEAIPFFGAGSACVSATGPNCNCPDGRGCARACPSTPCAGTFEDCSAMPCCADLICDSALSCQPNCGGVPCAPACKLSGEECVDIPCCDGLACVAGTCVEAPNGSG